MTTSARTAYAQWAPSYEAETVVSRLEELLVQSLGVSTARSRLLDVGCGTARRLRVAGAEVAVGVDITFEMLAARTGTEAVACADLLKLPFANGGFDVVWCRLMVGHVQALAAALHELARVSARGAKVVLSDLSPRAYEAGHRRTFRTASGELVEVEHHVHSVSEVVAAARSAGLELVRHERGIIDVHVRSLYHMQGADDLYERQQGTELVHAFLFARS